MQYYYLKTFPFYICIIAHCFLMVQSACQSDQICQWASWHDWSTCNATCGSGMQSRWRGPCCDGDSNLSFIGCIKHCNLSISYREHKQCSACPFPPTTIKRTTEQSTARTTEQSTERTTEQSTERTTEQSTERTTGQSTERTTEQSTQRTTGQSTERTTGQSTKRTTEQSTQRTTGQSTGMIMTTKLASTTTKIPTQKTYTTISTATKPQTKVSNMRESLTTTAKSSFLTSLYSNSASEKTTTVLPTTRKVSMISSASLEATPTESGKNLSGTPDHLVGKRTVKKNSSSSRVSGAVLAGALIGGLCIPTGTVLIVLILKRWIKKKNDTNILPARASRVKQAWSI